MSTLDLARNHSTEYKSVKRQLLSNISIVRLLLRTITPEYYGLHSPEQRMNALSTNSSLRPIALIDLYLYAKGSKECHPYNWRLLV